MSMLTPLSVSSFQFDGGNSLNFAFHLLQHLSLRNLHRDAINLLPEVEVLDDMEVWTAFCFVPSFDESVKNENVLS